MTYKTFAGTALAVIVSCVTGASSFASTLPKEQNDFWNTLGRVDAVTNSRASVPAAGEVFDSFATNSRSSQASVGEIFDSWWFNFKASDPISVFSSEPTGILLILR